MAWILTEKEFDAVRKFDSKKRFEHAIKKFADEERLWALYSDGWRMFGSDSGQTVFPVWPHQKYAEAYAVGEWSGSEAKAIDLDGWMAKWLPGLSRDGILVAVFRVADNGVVLTVDEMKSWLDEELEKY